MPTAPLDVDVTDLDAADLDAAELDAAELEVLKLGATRHEHQPGTKFRVFLDPAGHTFCLCL